jgi:hypothetical protein
MAIGDEAEDSPANSELDERFVWASELLREAGFELSDHSDAHGRSQYYLPADLEWGAADNHEEHVRIRVSDHHAPGCRRGDLGGQEVDFGVEVSPKHTAEAVRCAMKARAEYIGSPEYAKLCEEWRAVYDKLA